MEALETRLQNRKTETEESIKKRLDSAKESMDYAKTGEYDLVIVNDDVETAYQKLELFVATHWGMSCA